MSHATDLVAASSNCVCTPGCTLCLATPSLIRFCVGSTVATRRVGLFCLNLIIRPPSAMSCCHVRLSCQKFVRQSHGVYSVDGMLCLVRLFLLGPGLQFCIVRRLGPGWARAGYGQGIVAHHSRVGLRACGVVASSRLFAPLRFCFRCVVIICLVVCCAFLCETKKINK